MRKRRMETEERSFKGSVLSIQDRITKNYNEMMSAPMNFISEELGKMIQSLNDHEEQLAYDISNINKTYEERLQQIEADYQKQKAEIEYLGSFRQMFDTIVNIFR